MSERLPYELQLPQQWADLPLPDENLAWADMKRRLEEDDDDGIIAWWRRGCVLWSAVLLIAVAIGWWVFQPQKWFTTATEQTTPVETIKEKSKTDSIPKDQPSSNKDRTIETVPVQKETTETVKPVEPTNQESSVPYHTRTATPVKPSSSGRITSERVSPVNPSPHKPTTNERISPSSHIITNIPLPADQQNPSRVNSNTQQTKPAISTDVTSPSVSITTDSSHTDINKKEISTPDSSLTKTAIDSVKKKEPEEKTSTVAKKDSTKKRKIFFTSGIGEQQQIPIDGQKLTPYSSSGRKGSLGDYIPSIYFGINKPNKWFVNAEFRYGAPQYTKEILYKSQTKLDTSASIIYNTTTNAKLKKTFYHQLPVTFNYYVLPGWSVGAGLIWNKFSSAIAQQDITRFNTSTQDSSFENGIVKTKDKSVFANSYFQAVIESQYQWKKFSFGARYAFGLQPYIKFRLQNGTEGEERNRSLQVFLRYQLWRSKH